MKIVQPVNPASFPSSSTLEMTDVDSSGKRRSSPEHKPGFLSVISFFSILTILLFALLVSSCKSDSPTEPEADKGDDSEEQETGTLDIKVIYDIKGDDEEGAAKTAAIDEIVDVEMIVKDENGTFYDSTYLTVEDGYVDGSLSVEGNANYDIDILFYSDSTALGDPTINWMARSSEVYVPIGESTSLTLTAYFTGYYLMASPEICFPFEEYTISWYPYASELDLSDILNAYVIFTENSFEETDTMTISSSDPEFSSKTIIGMYDGETEGTVIYRAMAQTVYGNLALWSNPTAYDAILFSRGF